ncbi:hypothetical protein LCGC14_0427300 [marine sediment metagenome]|uniref:Uncharacterized protein n=1 Tax=marine sediment metagenome TaxID=412755 RepID=A0A0F9VYP5_9ZZZZ
MSKHKEDSEFVIEVKVDEEEIELDDDVISEFGNELQGAIELVVQNNITKDVRIELINVLMSIASQVSIDIGIGCDEFLGIADYFHEEGQKIADEEEIDLSKLN